MKKFCTILLALLGTGAWAAGLPPALEALFGKSAPPPQLQENGGFIQEAPPTAALNGKGQPLPVITELKVDDLQRMAFSGDGARLGLVTSDNLKIIGLSTRSSSQYSQANCDSILPGPGGSFVVNRDGAWLWNPDRPWPNRPFSKDGAACSSAQGRVVLTERGTLHDVVGRRSRPALDGQFNSYYNAALSADGRVLATFSNGHANAFGHDHGATEIIDFPSKRQLLAYDCGSYENCVAVSSDGSFVADAREDSSSVVNQEGEVLDEGTSGEGGITLFQRQASKTRVVCRWLPKMAARSVAFAQDRPWLVAALDNEVYLWTVPEGRLLAHANLGDKVTRVIVSAHRMIAASTEKGKVVVWDGSKL